jgi:hypothetical protein
MDLNPITEKWSKISLYAAYSNRDQVTNAFFKTFGHNIVSKYVSLSNNI